MERPISGVRTVSWDAGVSGECVRGPSLIMMTSVLDVVSIVSAAVLGPKGNMTRQARISGRRCVALRCVASTRTRRSAAGWERTGGNCRIAIRLGASRVFASSHHIRASPLRLPSSRSLICPFVFVVSDGRSAPSERIRRCADVPFRKPLNAPYSHDGPLGPDAAICSIELFRGDGDTVSRFPACKSRT